MLESSSQTGYEFSWSCQWFSNTGEQLTCWTCVQLFLSVVLKHWKVTHSLDVQPMTAILVSSSDLLKHWRVTHKHWRVSLNDSQAGQVISHSHQWFQSIQMVESNSQAGYVFSHFCQWFWSAQTLETHKLDMFSHFNQQFWSAQTLKSNSHSGSVLVSGSDLQKH